MSTAVHPTRTTPCGTPCAGLCTPQGFASAYREHRPRLLARARGLLADPQLAEDVVQEVLTSPNDAMIARTLVALADSLGLTVIAEGVETADQRQFLVENGCNHFQGYYFGRPADAEVVERRVLLQSGSMNPN